jgi:hypothetical protein
MSSLYFIARTSHVAYSLYVILSMCAHFSIFVVCSFFLSCLHIYDCVSVMLANLSKNTLKGERREDMQSDRSAVLGRERPRERVLPCAYTYVHNCICPRATSDTSSQSFWPTFILHFPSSKDLNVNK